MKLDRFIISLSIGTFFYVAFSILSGQSSLWAQNQLENQKHAISEHTYELQKITDELQLEKTALRNDKDVIMAYARKLDFVRDDEKLVKIKGLSKTVNQIYNTGTLMKVYQPTYVPEWFCKAIGIIIFGLTYLLLVLADLKKHTSRKKIKKYENITGMQIYDVS